MKKQAKTVEQWLKKNISNPEDGKNIEENIGTIYVGPTRYSSTIDTGYRSPPQDSKQTIIIGVGRHGLRLRLRKDHEYHLMAGEIEMDDLSAAKEAIDATPYSYHGYKSPTTGRRYDRDEILALERH